MTLTDTQRFWLLLRDAGTTGVHSFMARRAGLGNPSQRAKDTTDKGQQVWTTRENVGKRPGARYWLDGFQPEDATAVRPNGPSASAPLPLALETDEGDASVVDMKIALEWRDSQPNGPRWLEDETGCWIWQGDHSQRQGYGRFQLDGRLWQAHRYSYELLVGPIPQGLVIDHLCRNAKCVNPDHLEPVTHAENTRRGRSGEFQRAKTHCPQGHPYAGDNLHVRPGGRRACRTCQRDATRRKRAKERSASNGPDCGGAVPPRPVAAAVSVAWVRDYSDPEGEWEFVPTSELDLPVAA